mgnify:CR=1 FL=1|tara:strand:+ start:31995 stop:33614 length:1620 start_codon:yes stop_codon:yes gene_type:complete
MAMKVYQSGDLVVLEKNAEPVININISVCTFRIQDNIVTVFNRTDPTIENYDIVENIQDSLSAAVGNFAQVRAYLNAFILSGAAAPEILPLKSETFERITMNFEQEATLTSVMFKDPISGNVITSHDVNVIEAIANGTDIRIQLIGGHKILIDRLDLESIFIAGVLVTQVLATAVNELNGLFTNTGTSTNPPTITPASIALTFGNSINFTPTGTDVVTWTYDSLPTGVVSVAGQHKTIIGGSLLLPGTYNIIVRATNYYGSVTETIVLTVSAALVNTYSWAGSASSYFDTGSTPAQNNNSPFYMASGTSTGAAWTIFFWLKHLSTDGTGTFRGGLTFGAAHATIAGGVTNGIAFNSRSWGAPHNFMRTSVFVGLFPNRVYLLSPPITRDVWHSVMFTYDGTDINSSSAASFKLAIDGVDVTASGIAGYNGTGHGGGIFCSSTGLLNTHKLGEEPLANFVKISELVTFSGDLIADASTFHNGGSGDFDFAPYSPKQWYRCGDGTPTDISTYPLMANRGSVANVDMTLTSGTVGEYVSDVP